MQRLAPGQGYQLERSCAGCGSIEHGAIRVGGPRVWASVSRAQGWRLVAACDTGPVGVDVEPGGSVSAAVVRAVALHPLEAVADDAQATRIWVRKEAVLKAFGLGLTVDPRRMRLSHPDELPRVLDTGLVTGSDPRPGTLSDPPPSPGLADRSTQVGAYRAAAVGGPPHQQVQVLDLALPEQLCGAVAVLADRAVELSLVTAAAADG